MHKYMHHIGDFMSDTVHLSALEECFYRRALDFYYMNEKPLPKETQQVFRRLRAITEEEKNAVLNVLADFFTERDDGYHNKRADAEIADYHEKAESSRKNGKKGGRPSKNKANNNQDNAEAVNSENLEKTQQVILGYESETQAKGNHQPSTINHQPITNFKNPHTNTHEQKSSAENQNENSNTENSDSENSLDEILNLWIPDLHTVNSWLLRSGERAMTQAQFDSIKPEFLSYYADRLKSGVLKERALFGKFVSWVKNTTYKNRDFYESRSKPTPDHRNVNTAWQQPQEPVNYNRAELPIVTEAEAEDYI